MIVGDENILCERHLRRYFDCICMQEVSKMLPVEFFFAAGDSVIKSYRENSWYLKKYSRSWSRNSANKVWYWPWFVRSWSVGRTLYFLRVLIFSNFFLLLTYLIKRTRASENSSRTIRSILIMKRLKIAPIRFAFRANLSTSLGDTSQMRRGPTRADRRTLSVATGNYAASRSARY